MAEYIEREAAKRELVSDYAYAAADLLDRVPTADVAPVVHGRWVNRFNASVYECSECGTIGLPCWKGCPECLARMDGE